MSADDASHRLTTAAKDKLLNVIGVDLTSLVFRGKFVFLAQLGSPQKVVMELRNSAPPYGLGMDVLITGRPRMTGAMPACTRRRRRRTRTRTRTRTRIYLLSSLVCLPHHSLKCS